MDYIEYCGFKYGHDKENGYSIVPKDNDTIPSTFYKYYALTDYNVEALTNSYVYASHPNQFNDIFDCNSNIIKFDTWDDVSNLTGPLFNEWRKNYPILEDSCKQCSKAYWNILYRKVGIVCLAPNFDNYYMWALYSGNNGFCVEFDVKRFPFRHFGPFPINYVDTIPFPVHIGNVGGEIALLIQTNIKNRWWDNEHEWRLYIKEPTGMDMKYYGTKNEMKAYNRGDEHERKYGYPIEALQSIILGPKFFDRLETYEKGHEEIDIHCSPNDNNLEVQVLDFLAGIKGKMNLTTKLASLADFNNFIFVPIHVIKYAEGRYQVLIINS